MKKIPSSVWLYIASGVVVIGLFGFVIWNRGQEAAASEYGPFAQCLTDKGVIFYGAWWCPHCKNQKKMFGSAFPNVTYVECSPGGTKSMSQECQDAGVTGYPAWKLSDGTFLSGEQSFEDLAKASECALPL